MVGPSSIAVRPMCLDDARVAAAWAEDPEFCREAGWSLDVSLQQHMRFWRDLIEQPPKDLLRLGVIHQGELVGYVDLHGHQTGRRELGFTIGKRSRWGRGLGTRAALAGLGYGFDRVGLKEIWAEALAANQRSVRILRHVGMRETGRGDEGIFMDQLTYYRQFVITAREWPSSTSR